MALITQVAIRNFRSFQNLVIKPICPYTAITGLNNAGKSNILRALNLFFNEEVEPGKPLDWKRDYNIYVHKKQRKEISVEIEFKLPSIFNFPKGLESAKNMLLGGDQRTFSIKKEWRLKEKSPFMYLNGEIADGKKGEDLKKFLGLIKYIYIPHYVSPIELFDKDSNSFIAEALHRLRKGGKKADEDSFKDFLDNLNKQIVHLWSDVSTKLKSTTGADVELTAKLPSSLEELVSNLRPRLSILYEGNYVLEAELQGAGVQLFTSLLLLYSLHRSQPGRSFGWLQAVIWGVEEPENSLHKSLEAQMAAFFQRNARENPRFQFIITTHSETFAGYSDCIVSLKKEGAPETIASVFQGKEEIRKGLKEMGRTGIGVYIEPMLTNPLGTVILVEGKSDKFLIERALKCLQLDEKEYMVLSPEELGMNSSGTGNIEVVLEKFGDYYLVPRPGNLCIILDWDTKKKTYNKIQKLARKLRESFQAIKLDEQYADSRVTAGFKGIERFLSYDFLQEARDKYAIELIKETKDGKLVIEDPNKYNTEVKERLQKIYMNMEFSCKSIQPLLEALKSKLECFSY